MNALNTTTHHETHEQVTAIENQLFATPSLNHRNEGGRNSEIPFTVLTPSQNLKGNANNSDLIVQHKLVNNSDDTLDLIRIEHTQNLCADLIDSYVHTSTSILKANYHCSIMQDHCYDLTHICATLHANNDDHVKLITHDEFFIRISPVECVCYVMLDEFVEIGKMLECVLHKSSMKSLNSAYSCKFTFNIIVHLVENKFYVCAICITCDKLAELKLNKIVYLVNHIFLNSR